ncbi:MAG: AMP-binding protein [Pseudomonadales bacterium]|nr:AMP-binding protein [Pseudomonadales bacterium]
MSLYEALSAAAAQRPAQIALSGDALAGPGITYGALHERAGRWAAGLAALGVQPGDRVVVQAEKSAEVVVLYLATLRAGAVYVPLNTAYTPREMRYFLDDAEPTLAVLPEPGAFPEWADRCVLRSLATPAFAEELDQAPAPLAPVPREAKDLAAILYTSGTTGRSKGAMLSHGNLLSNARTLRSLWGWQRDDVLLHTLPIYHVHGLFVALHCAMLEPSEVRFLPRFSPEAVLAELPTATVYMGVPTHYVRLLDAPGLSREASEGMRLWVSGSAPLRPETHEAFQARTGQAILERYGMSEAGMITSNPLHGERRPGTVGFALPEGALRLRSEAGEPVPDGGVGVLEIQGPNVFSGYWKQPDKTAESFRGSWFITGDMAQIDETGRVTIVGRHKDLVISGGLNVYPREVESVLDTLPGVVESAVIGVPHRDFGEAVVAVLVLDEARYPGDEATLEGLREQLAAFKVPKALFAMAELPRNTMGKVQKHALRSQFEAIFGAEATP